MTYWWTSAFHLRGAFLTHSSVRTVPMSKVSPRTFSFLIIPQPYFNQFWVSRSPSLPRCPSLNFPRRQMCWKERGLEEGWQACVTAERFTWGHKSQGEREGGIAHIKGSVCEDREVNWPSQSRRLDSPYAPPAHTLIHTLPSGWRLFSFWTKHPHPNILSLWLTLLSCVSVKRTRTLTLFYHRPLSTSSTSWAQRSVLERRQGRAVCWHPVSPCGLVWMDPKVRRCQGETKETL